MGGCCCSSRRPHLHGRPVYYYCPPGLEGHESLASRGGSPRAITAGLLVHLDLETSIPDTYRSPPAPLPYDVVLGCQRLVCGDLEDSECKTQVSTLVASPRKIEKSDKGVVSLSAEEEDGCPICLEEYDEENPKMMTKCEHHFHLSCILEWMERSESCPICDQETVFDNTCNYK